MTIANPTAGLQLECMVDGTNPNTWGDRTNLNWQRVENAVNGAVALAMDSGDVTLTIADTLDSTTDAQFRYPVYAPQGTGSVSRKLILPSALTKSFFVRSTYPGPVVVTTAASGGTTVTLRQGDAVALYSDGTNINPSTTMAPGAMRIGGALTVTVGGASITGNVAVTGNTNLVGNASVTGTMSVGGATTLNTISAQSETLAGALTVNGQATMALLTCNSALRSTGYQTRFGTGGSFGGNAFNFYWSGSALYAYIDTTSVGTVAFTSDRRVKRDITDLPSGSLGLLTNLRPRVFRFADHGAFRATEGYHAGFIADELQAVIPSAVTGSAGETAEDGSPALQSVNPLPVLAHLVAAMQELRAELAELQRRFADA